MPALRPGRGAGPHDLAVARPLHARADERRAVLCAAGPARRADAGRVRRPGRGEPRRRAGRRRLRARPWRLAEPVRAAGRQADQARPEGGAAEHRPGRARHAGPHRLCRRAAVAAGQGRRDGGRGCRERCGRRHRRPARQDRRLPGGGRRRRRRQVPLRRGRARLRRLPRPPRARPRRPAEGGLPDGVDVYIELVGGELLWARAAAVQPARPHPGDRRRSPGTTCRACPRAPTARRCCGAPS